MNEAESIKFLHDTDWGYWVRNPRVREMLGGLRAITTTDPFDAAKAEVATLALAAIPRVGADSPASLLAVCSPLLRWFAEGFVLRHKVVDKINVALSVEELVLSLNEVSRHAEEKDERFISRLVLSGGIGAILSAMGRLATVAEVQRAGIRAIAGITEARLKGVDARMAERGGIEVVVGAMYCLRGYADVALCGCRTLRNVAIKSANRTKIADRGGIDAVLVAMQMHRREPEILKQALGALAVVSLGEGTELRIAERGGIEAIIDAMALNRTHHGVQKNGCWALSNLAFAEANLPRIVACGGIEAILGAMALHRANPTVAENGAWAIANLAFDSTNEAKIAERGGIETIVTTMQLHKGVPGLQRACARTLASVLSTPHQHARFMAQPIVDAVAEAATRFADLREIQHSLNSILRIEDPAVARAKQENVCTLVHAPSCAEPCRARSGFYCPQCFVPQRMFACDTCEAYGACDSNTAFCEVCARRCHPGHNTVETFEPGRCGCTRCDCKIMPPIGTPTKQQQQQQ
jgi:hypothetical protein